MNGVRRQHLTNRHSPRAARSGFSLVELLIVLALVGLLLAAGLPSYLNAASNQRVRAAARTLVSDLYVARQEAVTRRATVIVRFAAADGACAAEAYASYSITEGSTVIKRTCLSPDVTWVSLPPGTLRFQSTGTPESGMSLLLRSVRTGVTYTVRVAPETGAITDDTP